MTEDGQSARIGAFTLTRIFYGFMLGCEVHGGMALDKSFSVACDFKMLLSSQSKITLAPWRIAYRYPTFSRLKQLNGIDSTNQFLS